MKRKPQPRRWSRSQWVIAGPDTFGRLNGYWWLYNRTDPNLALSVHTTVLPPGRKRKGQAVTMVLVFPATPKKR